jgi:hypothetical protein
MRPCDLIESPDVEMYFYGELDAADGRRVEMHLRACEACRQRLEDLHAIRRALASRPAVDAPPAGDWSGFMRRLDDNIAQATGPSNAGITEPANPGTGRLWNLRAVVALAAMLALVAMGVMMAARFRPAPGAVEGTAPVSAVPASVPAIETVQKADPRPHRALREGSAEHLERSKLVVVGLATRDPHARSEDWQYERTLAGTLLHDTRLYRQAALHGGVTDVARVMRDLETVLLEASMSDNRDRDALERVQRLIAKRDLMVKMQVVTAAGPAGN